MRHWVALGMAWLWAPPMSKSPEWIAFDPREHPGFALARPALRALLKRDGLRRGGPQHFCIVAYRRSDGNGHPHAQVHWREERKMILWEPPDPAFAAYGADALVHSRRALDLDIDVVATADGIDGSTYLVSRAWVADTIADCARVGARYVEPG